YTYLGMALRELGQLEEIIAWHRKAVQLGVATPPILSDLTHNLQQVCDWTDVMELSQRVMEAVAGNSGNVNTAPAAPFQFLALAIPTTASQQHQCARQWAAGVVRGAKCEVRGQQPQAAPRLQRSKLTIGYLSFDFRVHAVAYLIPELIEKHDRERFTIVGYS